MSEQLMGVDYFSLETNAKDDDKIFDLKYRYGMPDGADDYDHGAAWAAYGRFVELLASIYADGFAIEVTKQRVLRMSQQLGMTAKEFQDFVQTCVDVGLFDDGLWCREKVLTSRGIQKRYFHAVKRRKGDIPEEYKRWILVGSATDDDSESAPCGNDASTMQTSCKHDANTMKHDAGYIEKKRKEEKRKGKEKEKRREKARLHLRVREKRWKTSQRSSAPPFPSEPTIRRLRSPARSHAFQRPSIHRRPTTTIRATSGTPRGTPCLAGSPARRVRAMPPISHRRSPGNARRGATARRSRLRSATRFCPKPWTSTTRPRPPLPSPWR